MKRLTPLYEQGCNDCQNEPNCDVRACGLLRQIVDKLTAYEDTGLSPEEVALLAENRKQIILETKFVTKELSKEEFENITRENTMLQEQLAIYQQAKEEGRILPVYYCCKNCRNFSEYNNKFYKTKDGTLIGACFYPTDTVGHETVHDKHFCSRFELADKEEQPK